MNCRKIIKVTQPYNLKLIAGKSGLNRIISWFHYMENPKYMDWLKGNELVLTTGLMLNNNTDTLISFIKELYDRDVTGLIINLSPYIPKIPKEVIELGDFLGFPIFEAAAEVHIVDISESICKSIIESNTTQNVVERFLFTLIYDRVSFNDRTFHKAADCGYLINQQYRTIIITVSTSKSPSISDMLLDEDIDMDIMKLMDSHFKLWYSKTDLELLSLCENNMLICMYPTDDSEIISDTIDVFIKSFEAKYPLYHAFVGISPIWKDLRDFKNSYQKALKALKLISFYSEKPSFLLYEELDVYSSLFSMTSMEELFSLYETVFKKIELYDSSANSDLILTLSKYIEMNCNLMNTAKELFIHVNTLRYRLKKVEQILGCDLKNIEDICKLNLSLKAKKYLDLFWNEQL